MTGYIPDIILEVARELRKNMTLAEKELWKHLRGEALGNKIPRQKPIFLHEETKGSPRYCIPDFCCLEKKIIIELDGGIHDREDIYLLDREKVTLLQDKGFTILGFQNEEVFDNMDRVIKKIATSFP